MTIRLFGDVFRGKRVFITGGTSGIGLAIGRAFAAHDARVTVTGLTDPDVRSPDLAGLEVMRLDVTDGPAVGRAIGELGTLDVLVTCAGILKRHEEHTLGTFERVVDVNLTGTMRCCVAARPLLAASKGCIVNTASMLSFFGGSLVPGYSASKGGVAQLTKSLAIAYAVEGIRVNAVAPGWISTPLTDPIRSDPARSGPILDRTPLKRWGAPEDVAGPVLFLCSPAADFVTGAILPVDGGYLVT